MELIHITHGQQATVTCCGRLTLTAGTTMVHKDMEGYASDLQWLPHFCAVCVANVVDTDGNIILEV